MARVTANFNIPREDVYEETVKMHREAGSFNKLLTSLVTAYHDSIEVRTVIEAKMNGVERAESRELDDLLNRMKNTIASSDILTEEGAFAGVSYSEEVKEGYSAEDLEGIKGLGNVEGLAEEVENIKTDLKDIKDLLKGLVQGGVVVQNSGEPIADKKQVQTEYPEVLNKVSKLEEQKPNLETGIVDEEVEIFTNVPTEVYSAEKEYEEQVETVEYVDEEESEDLLNNLLSGGVLI